MVYIRVADQNLLANRVLLKVWERENKPKGVFLKFTEKEKILLEFLEKNPTITVSRFCRMARISRQKAEDILVKFILLKTIYIIFTEKQTFYSLKG
jgi:predicted HTH transcriptional regulator